MRKISRSFALSSDSIPDVKGSVEMEVLRLRRELHMRSGDRGIFPAHLLNYVASWYLSQPKGVRDRIAGEGERIFNARLAGPPQLWDVDADDPPSVEGDGNRVAAKGPVASRRPRQRDGGADQPDGDRRKAAVH